MAKTRKAWRWVVALSAAALALALMTSAFAQGPPLPPHQFFGSVETGTGALLDGEPAADDAVVTAWNADTEDAVGTGAIADGTWLIQVDGDAASSVVFSIDGGSRSGPFPIVSGDLTEVALDLESASMAMAAPSALPDTGSGGLADSSGSGFPALPLALAIAAIVALGGVAAVRRSSLSVR